MKSVDESIAPSLHHFYQLIYVNYKEETRCRQALPDPHCGGDNSTPHNAFHQAVYGNDPHPQHNHSAPQASESPEVCAFTLRWPQKIQ